MLDDLHDLLKTIYDHDESERKILLEITVLVIVGASKDKRSRSYADKFRDTLLDIIKQEIDKTESIDWFVSTTLPAFVIIVKSSISNKTAAVNEISTNNVDGNNKSVPHLIKTYLKHSVII